MPYLFPLIPVFQYTLPCSSLPLPDVFHAFAWDLIFLYVFFALEASVF